jgi:hypothetical protein
MKLAGWLLAALLAIPCSAGAQAASTTLQWTATGDDSLVGRATQYDGRYSPTRPDTLSSAAMASWWSAATVIPGLPAPLVAGSAQSLAITPAGGFAAGTTYYFVLRVADEVPNWSRYSNVAWRLFADGTAPAPIIDLR